MQLDTEVYIQNDSWVRQLFRNGMFMADGELHNGKGSDPERWSSKAENEAPISVELLASWETVLTIV